MHKFKPVGEKKNNLVTRVLNAKLYYLYVLCQTLLISLSLFETKDLFRLFSYAVQYKFCNCYQLVKWDTFLQSLRSTLYVKILFKLVLTLIILNFAFVCSFFF